MDNKFKILIPQNNPPKTYLRALDLVGLDYQCLFNPTDFCDFDGLLLPGGGDVLPFFYNRKTNFSNANLIKDATEFNAIEFFYKNKLPILGVCRGLQLLNVFFGGTLKNVAFHQGQDGNDIFHDVITPSFGAFKTLTRVNSNHLQCVDKLCKCARCVCYTKDGVVEGFLIDETVIAVQFHPERMGTSTILTVYGAFSNAVKNFR